MVQQIHNKYISYMGQKNASAVSLNWEILESISIVDLDHSLDWLELDKRKRNCDSITMPKWVKC